MLLKNSCDPLSSNFNCSTSLRAIIINPPQAMILHIHAEFFPKMRSVTSNTTNKADKYISGMKSGIPSKTCFSNPGKNGNRSFIYNYCIITDWIYEYLTKYF